MLFLIAPPFEFKLSVRLCREIFPRKRKRERERVEGKTIVS